MKTQFTEEEWDEFRDDCETYAWRAGEIRRACWKAIALIEQSYERETHGEVRQALARLRKNYISHLDELETLQRHCEACKQDEATQADNAFLHAHCAIRKIIAWPQQQDCYEELSSRPIEYSCGNAEQRATLKSGDLDKTGVWHIHFSLSD